MSAVIKAIHPSKFVRSNLVLFRGKFKLQHDNIHCIYIFTNLDQTHNATEADLKWIRGEKILCCQRKNH